MSPVEQKIPSISIITYSKSLNNTIFGILFVMKRCITMTMNRIMVPMLIFILLFGFSSFAAYVSSQEQLTVEEASNLFQQIGCVSCHMPNGAAKSFDEILSLMAEKASQYNGNIDEYVRNEVVYFGNQKFDSFEEMMKVMQQNVGASDEDMAKLNAFFKNYFEAAAKGKVAQEGEAKTAEEQAPTQEEKSPDQEKPAEEKVAKQPQNIPAIVFGVAAIVIIAVLLVVFTARK